MKSRNGFLLSVISIAALGISSANALPPSLISGKSVNLDPATGHALVEKPRITAERLIIEAGRGEYTIDQSNTPRVVDLSSGVMIDEGGITASASNATFYPELQLLSTSQLTVRTTVGPLAVISYTCQSGTLFANGVSTGGSSACHGFSDISCGGPGGNSVIMVKRKLSCGQ